MNYYVGFDIENHRWQVFRCDSPEQATPLASGYFAVSEPMDKATAETFAKELNS